MVEVTTLTKARPGAKSLRTTVPISIIRQFNLKQKDKLEWTMEARENKIVVIVKPVQ